MTDQTARALVVKWRAEAKPHRGATGDEAEIAYAKDRCADDLEAAIAREGTAAEGPAQGEAERMDKRTTGLYHKFNVSRTDGTSAPGGKHDGCDYFVLDLTHDPHAPAAIRAYADSCRADYPKLAADLDARALTPPPVRAEEHVSPPESVRIGGFDYTANPDGSVSRTDWRDDQSRERVNEILSRERLFNALTEALTRTDAAEQALRDVAAHVHALFPMDSPGPAPGHEASFIIHTTNHMNDSRRAASVRAEGTALDFSGSWNEHLDQVKPAIDALKSRRIAGTPPAISPRIVIDPATFQPASAEELADTERVIHELEGTPPASEPAAEPWLCSGCQTGYQPHACVRTQTGVVSCECPLCWPPASEPTPAAPEPALVERRYRATFPPIASEPADLATRTRDYQTGYDKALTREEVETMGKASEPRPCHARSRTHELRTGLCSRCGNRWPLHSESCIHFEYEAETQRLCRQPAAEHASLVAAMVAKVEALKKQAVSPSPLVHCEVAAWNMAIDAVLARLAEKG